MADEADLDAAIRSEIDYAVTQIKGCDPDTFVEIGADELQAALLAVLDKHVTDRIGEDGEPYCRECSSLAGIRVYEPCVTKRAIAGALGIEVAAT